MTGWKPLAGVKVIEACQRLVGAQAGLHLAMLGADVIKVEPPGGDVARDWAEGVFDTLNAGKTFVSLDLASAPDQASFQRLVEGAQVVLADSDWSAELALAAAKSTDAATRVAVVVDNGSAPGGYGNSETVVQAALAVSPYLGHRTEPPLRVGADMASASAAAAATQAALAALSGDPAPGPLVARVSADRAMVALKAIQWPGHADPSAWLGYHVTASLRGPDIGYRTRDGLITFEFAPQYRAGWQAFCEELGLTDFARRVGAEGYATTGLEDRIDEARSTYEGAFVHLTADETIALVRKHGGWAVRYNSVPEALGNPQSALYASFGFDGNKAFARLPWRVGNLKPEQHDLGPAPSVGAHQAKASASTTEKPSRPPACAKRPSPLHGTKVVNFGIGGVAPWGASQLAQLGADVVKIEAPNEFTLFTKPPWHDLTVTYISLNTNCRSVSLNLKNESDIALAWSLVEGADVLIENFRSGAIDRMGFGFEAVSRRNPRIVFCSSSGFGREGDMAGLACTDPHMQAFSGFASLNGDGERAERFRYYAAIDVYSGQMMTEAAIAGLIERNRSNSAQYIELSMLGSATSMLASQFAGYLRGAGTPTALGHAGRHCAPDGLYPTADGAIALTADNDATFQALCTAIARPDLLDDPRFRTNRDRLVARVELDSELRATFATTPAEWWLIACKRAGVPCAIVNSDAAALNHRDSWQRGYFRDVEVTERGHIVLAAPIWDFDDYTPPARAPGPGQDSAVLQRERGGFWQALEKIRW